MVLVMTGVIALTSSQHCFESLMLFAFPRYAAERLFSAQLFPAYAASHAGVFPVVSLLACPAIPLLCVSKP
jgi:hypothetical protein